MTVPDEHPARWWHRLPDERLECRLCPRLCRLREGQRGFCFVRQAERGGLVLTTYGRGTGLQVDPIEKKPLFHFLPGSKVLSFGTAGCNLGCRFCQNWIHSKSRAVSTGSNSASPRAIAASALERDCASGAFTYNDPVIFAEYALDTAAACRALGVRTVAVTAGYITDEARATFFSGMDAANVDLKAFRDEFYREHCLTEVGALETVLDTLCFLRHESETWLEITTLLIPGLNDSDGELREMSRWIVDALGPDVPHHFSAFHPAFRLTDRPRTPPATVRRAREIAREEGERYVYTGNIHDPEGQTTRCASCAGVLVERSGYRIGEVRIDEEGRCLHCGAGVPGRYRSG